MTQTNRRQFVQTCFAAGAASLCASTVSAANGNSEVRIISQNPNAYYGWPTVGQSKDGRLFVVSSAGREAHICPFGRVEFMVSKDEGKTWGASRVLLDSDMDDRDAGFLETDKGTLLVTTFSSLAYEPILERAEKLAADDPKAWPKEKLSRWIAARDRLTPEQRKERLGTWMLRSTDGGLTWSAPYRCLVNSPHGPTQLKDGTLFYAGKKLWDENKTIGVAISKDDGVTWQWLSEIPHRQGDNPSNEYHELHAVEADDGTILVQIRNHNKDGAGETFQTESKDGGKTWTIPHKIGVWGLPSHLLKLKDGRLLMTYGYRRQPFGNYARISSDHGKTWGEAMTISDDATNGDLGYPSTVQLKDGSLLTVWYEYLKPEKRCVLRQAIWKLR